jgi:hypothetical protein
LRILFYRGAGVNREKTEVEREKDGVLISRKRRASK